MTRLELLVVNQLKDEQVYAKLTEIKAQIENDEVQEHAAANKQMLRVLRRMINMNNRAVMDVFQLIEMASGLHEMARAFDFMSDDGMNLIDEDIYDRIEDEWHCIAMICKIAILEELGML